MSNTDEYLKEWEKMKSKSGFNQKDFSVTTTSGILNMSLHGPENFLNKMPKLIETVSKAPYNSAMFKALARSGKQLSVVYTEDRALLSSGRLYKPQSWYCFVCSKEVSHLMLLFNTQGYHEKIYVECMSGKDIVQKQEFDDVKFTLIHELFHLWSYIEPGTVPKKGRLPRTMNTPINLRNECWATRYANGWRYQEKRCIRYIYQHQGKNHHVDSITNYK